MLRIEPPGKARRLTYHGQIAPAICLGLVCAFIIAVSTAAAQSVNLADVRLRDPQIFADEATQTYYLVSSIARPPAPAGRERNLGVSVFISKDLVNWQGPIDVFTVPPDAWARHDVWAPEMHRYQGKYYIFTTFDSTDKYPEQWRGWLPRVKRGCVTAVADSPLGPFHLLQNAPSTPADMMTLDGTLWVEDGQPYLVYCHEWVQISNGTVELLRLKPDLSATEGEPVMLFRGSDAPWALPSKTYGCFVTDGPWPYRTKTGKLLMIWSGFGAAGYTVGIAESESGKITGPWKQQPGPLFARDGGHAALLRTFDGRLMITLHQPNKNPNERMRMFEVEDTGDTLRIRKLPQ